MCRNVLERIRAAVREGRHRFSDHAVEEVHADGLHVVDAESALLTGTLHRVQTDETRWPVGPKFTVEGAACDLSTELVVVCRFDPDDQLIIITCYVRDP
jgi:hypothetical protein